MCVFSKLFAEFGVYVPAFIRTKAFTQWLLCFQEVRVSVCLCAAPIDLMCSLKPAIGCLNIGGVFATERCHGTDGTCNYLTTKGVL